MHRGQAGGGQQPMLLRMASRAVSVKVSHEITAMGAGRFQPHGVTSGSYWPAWTFPCRGGNQPGSWHKWSIGVPREEKLGCPRAAGDGQGDVVGTTAGAAPSPGSPPLNESWFCFTSRPGAEVCKQEESLPAHREQGEKRGVEKMTTGSAEEFTWSGRWGASGDGEGRGG